MKSRIGREHVPDRRTGTRCLATDERAVSTTLGYALSLTVATLLVGGLLVASGGFVEDQRERTVRGELQVIGQQVSADVAAADRLVETDGTNDKVVVTRNLPETVTGVRYAIAVESDEGETYLVLSTDSPDVSVQVHLATETPVTPTDVSGGDVRVVYDPSVDELEVQHG